MTIVSGLIRVTLVATAMLSVGVAAQETQEQRLVVDPDSKGFFTTVARAAPEYPANYSRHNAVSYLVVEYSPLGQKRAAPTRVPVTSGGNGDETAAAVLHRWKY